CSRCHWLRRGMTAELIPVPIPWNLAVSVINPAAHDRGEHIEPARAPRNSRQASSQVAGRWVPYILPSVPAATVPVVPQQVTRNAIASAGEYVQPVLLKARHGEVTSCEESWERLVPAHRVRGPVAARAVKVVVVAVSSAAEAIDSKRAPADHSERV